MKVGFIGLGNVGSKLARSLLRNKFDLTVRDIDVNLTKGFANFSPTFPKPIKPTFILTSNHFFFTIVEIVDKSPSLST